VSDAQTPRLRASDADREAAVGRLRVAAMEGRLDAEELAERVSIAYGAKFCSELAPLTADVTPAPATVAVSAPVFQVPVSRTNGFAIAALVSGLLWMWWVGSVCAVIFGHIALRQIARSRGGQGGRGLAIAGASLGYLGLAAFLITAFAVVFGW
jgi:hypothetical protein